MTDFSELTELAVDLGMVPARTGRNVKKAVEVTARNVKDDWAQGAAVGSGGFTTSYASSIDYEMKFGVGEISAEVGPNRGKAGGSAGFLEDAPGGVRSAPQHAGRDALRANEADLERGLAIAVLDAWEGR